MQLLQLSTAPAAPPSARQHCSSCRDGETGLFPFSMAFQPIVDVPTRTTFAYEALVRGPEGEPASMILSQVNDHNRYAFDQACRVRAIHLAAHLDLPSTGAHLSVNFMPGAVYSPAACIRRTLAAAHATGFPLDKLIFEVTENERLEDLPHLQQIVAEYRKHGFSVALDDFGAGYSGLNLLAGLAVHYVKLDAALVRGLPACPRARAIVRSTADLCHQLNATIIAECVETTEEYDILQSCGIRLMQGYLFARPSFESLPSIHWP